MPDEQELATATNLVVALAWVGGAVVAAYLAGLVVSWVIARVGRRASVLADVNDLSRRPIRVLLMVIAATIAIERTVPQAEPWRNGVDHGLLIAMIATVTWLLASLVKVVERRVISRYGGGDTEMTDADRQRRRVRTQVIVLRRLAVAVLVLLGVAASLMTFPAFSNIGTTLFASAGVLSVVAGLAAQTSLGAVFAGMQIAFSGAIRVGDVVVVEEQWGRVEEITLSYVVVRLWDERRLVLPSTYFTTTPFENWTRSATELMGTVEFDVDFTMPFDDMRAELDRLLQRSQLWDGRTGIVQVTDAIGGSVRVRMLVSAPNASALFDLRCEVREGMVDWLQRNHDMLPSLRVDIDTEPPTSQPTAVGGGTPAGSATTPAGASADRPRNASHLFSGSPEADRRARDFDGVDDERDGRRAANAAETTGAAHVAESDTDQRYSRR